MQFTRRTDQPNVSYTRTCLRMELPNNVVGCAYQNVCVIMLSMRQIINGAIITREISNEITDIKY